MNKWPRKPMLPALILCALGVGLAFVWPNKDHYAFRVVEDFPIFNVNDAGIADLDGNGRIDLWTTNHSAAQWIRLDPLDTNTENVAGSLGLYQDTTLPGFETGNGSIPEKRPIRIYMDEFHFVVDVAESYSGSAVTGQFDIPWRFDATATGAADIVKEPCDRIPECRRLRFSISNGGKIQVLPIPAPSDGFEIAVDLGPELDLSNVQLGALAIEPGSHKFTYRSRDRHSMAMSERDAEGNRFVFVGRGGARGRLGLIEPDARDELFRWDGETFTDVMAQYRYEKAACPGRQSAWHDINGDSLADLYLVCGRSGLEDDNSGAANRLYVQNSNGEFIEDGAKFGLDLHGIGTFRFLPQLSISDPSSMLWVAENELALYAMEGVAFHKLWSRERLGGGSEKVLVNDFDGNGVWDVFIFSRFGNEAFAITDTGPVPHDIEALGLPPASEDAIYADLNGDGQRDILAAPQGIFVAKEQSFEHSQLIDLSWTDGLPVRLAVFDRDGDGDLDVWCLAQNGTLTWRVWRIIYNRVPEGFQNWLEDQFGTARFRIRYWRSVFYENTTDVGSLQVLSLSEASAVQVTIRPNGDEDQDYRLNLFPGIDEPSRFSDMFSEIFLSIPQGAEVIEVKPVQAGATYEIR